MNYFLISVFLLQIILIIYFAIKKPYVKFGKFSLESYALVALIGPIILFIAGYLTKSSFSNLTFGETNPVNILILFLSMVFISTYLDEVGFIEYCARLAIQKARRSILKLFIYLYVVVSILTIFTSNDIVILTFTPFIYYFAKNARINPKPFLFAEFFAANTWSLMLQIGNPTNIYISTSYGISFLEYLKVMWLPTIVAGLFNLGIIYLIFKKGLEKDFKPSKINPLDAIKDELGAKFGVFVLLVCTLFLSIASYVNLPLWQIALYSAITLATFIIIRTTIVHKDKIIRRVMRKIPWSIIPFVFSFFILVKELEKSGLMLGIANWLYSFGSSNIIYSYGITSAFASNILNNIPMSVAFTQIMSGLHGQELLSVIYATIIGSNIGAYFTPIGALAGIMWLGILRRKGIKITFLEFIKYGLFVGLLTLIVALVMLGIVLN